MGYFYNKVTGLNKDIERHCAKERELIEKINTLDTSTDMGMATARSYFQLLTLLENSKMEVVKNLGKKK